MLLNLYFDRIVMRIIWAVIDYPLKKTPKVLEPFDILCKTFCLIQESEIDGGHLHKHRFFPTVLICKSFI
jgi:hypothetical protein